MQRISANLYDAAAGKRFPAVLEIENGRIARIRRDSRSHDRCIVPALVDAHVHIESSLMAPSEFARLAVTHGAVAAVSDPHEIANVLGKRGVDFMIDNAARTPFKFFFGAPSCVPATTFETSGARLDAASVAALLARDDIYFLSEMMNFPGVVSGNAEVSAKIAAARARGKPVDGHAPGLRGEPLRAYAAAGISTDHETLDRDEALEKLGLGMKLLIREGSAAKNFDELVDFIGSHPDQCMFCTDDCHPDDLISGHIDQLVRRALGRGLDPFSVLRAASVNPVRHYRLPVGLLQEGDPADFVVVDSMERFRILETWIDGRRVAMEGRTLLDPVPVRPVNRFAVSKKSAADFAVPHAGGRIRAIRAIDGRIATEAELVEPKVLDGLAVSDSDRDLLKLTVVNRYHNCRPAAAFVRGFGLKRGAFASSVAHDSHNIVAVGCRDDDLSQAVNSVIAARGGLSAVCDGAESVLPLPIAGLMSDASGPEIAKKYKKLTACVRQMGCPFHSPFMTLSFMALLVIPSLKLSDRGLFDGRAFAFTSLYAD